MLKLFHGATSTCSKRVRMTFAEKKLVWESHHISLAKRENLQAWYKKINPNGVVPTLMHDEKIICESNFIIEYLDETFPENPLRPHDLFDRAQMRIWMDRFEHVLHRNINTVSWIKQGRYKRFDGMDKKQLGTVYKSQATEEQRTLLKRRLEKGVSEAEMAYAEARVAEILDKMEKELTKQPWLCGNSLSLADISVAPFIERFEANKMPGLTDWQKRPSLGLWWKKIQARESFQIAFSFTPNS